VPEYRYEAIDERGNLIKGEVTAFDEQSLESKLLQKGLILVKYKKKKEISFSLFERVKPKLIIEFYNRLAQALKIGLPIITALEEIEKGIPSRKLKKIIAEIVLAVEAGSPLYEAMEKFQGIFSRLELSVIRIGETSGRLPDCLKELADFLEWKQEVKSIVKRASIYPMFISILVFAVVGIWIGYVLPKTANMLLDMGIKLPTVTVILLKLSLFMKKYYIDVIKIVFVFLFILFLTVRSPQGKKLLHKYILNIPTVGDIIRGIVFSRLCKNFAVMYAAGVSIKEIFEILVNALGNVYIEEKIALVYEYIQSGSQLSEAFESVGIFPAFFVGAIRNGELTGTLEEAFKRLGQFYDKEAKDRVQILLSTIEPITMIILGGVFGLVAISILFPLYNLIGSFGKSY